MEKTKYRQPLWIQQFYGLPKDRKEAEARPVTIVAAGGGGKKGI